MFLYYNIPLDFMDKKHASIFLSMIFAGLLFSVSLLSGSNIFAAETNLSNSNSLKGAITSIQNDASGKPAWIISGVFKIDNYSNDTKTTTSPILNASFYMIKLDGTSPHTHTISDFKMTGSPQTSGNVTTISGTSTVTMKEGPVKNVPTTIKVFDRSAISFMFDPAKVQNHFGNTPIYGTHHLICVEKPTLCA
jgi:hypothetical protein